jgi:hypothetical protein
MRNNKPTILKAALLVALAALVGVGLVNSQPNGRTRVVTGIADHRLNPDGGKVPLTGRDGQGSDRHGSDGDGSDGDGGKSTGMGHDQDGGPNTTDPDGSTTTTTDPGHPTTTTMTDSTTTTEPPTSTTSTTVGPSPGSPFVAVCGVHLCIGSTSWPLYGATIYNPGLRPYQSGVKNPAGTIALAKLAHLNTIRITDFLNSTGNPAVDPYDAQKWGYVDGMIAAAGAAGLHVDLGLSDYRAMLWNNCINPYTADWNLFVSFVANRVNSVSGRVYKNDPAIALVSVAGEPLPVGSHSFTAKATGQPCTISYSTADLTSFYTATTGAWAAAKGSVLINSGGLGYLNETHAGIDWKTIFSLPTNAVCDIKTYGGMFNWVANAASYCASIGKPIVDEEFGYQQGSSDAQRADLFAQNYNLARSLDFAGIVFWNLGYQMASTSYEVNPSTPLTFQVVQNNAP